MGSEIPKQFLLLHQQPILFHTINKFLQVPDIQLIIVLPEKDLDYWHTITKPYPFNLLPSQTLQIAIGGKTRFLSVKNGLKMIEGDGIVAVHDGVRPLVSLEIIQNSFQIAQDKGNAVTSVQSKDSIRLVSENGSNQTIERNKVRLMQTPQAFRLDIFRKAFEADDNPLFTDCASVVEYAGFSINLIEGAYENIKITTPEDLILAENILLSAS
jgi:2-C-methyl-D-erythritol 4-phosphate cytidylyltransferase